MVQGEDLTDAQPGFDQRTSEPVVNFRFNIRGGQQFGQVTSENVGKPFAIVLDNQVVSTRESWARSPGARDRFREISLSRRRMTWRCCCGPAPCRPS